MKCAGSSVRHLNRRTGRSGPISSCGDWMTPAKESMPAPDIVKEIAEEAVQVMRNANDLIRE